ncbi:MAG: hypothetical protein KGI38_08110 [Thaumarchaeota archaeon]|nr:hypothetical protein [Nitrososphaerota archaeon]
MRSHGRPDWQSVNEGMRVVRLGVPLRVLVPVLAFLSVSKSTRGMTLYPGRTGVGLGLLLTSAGVLIGLLLLGPAGVLGAVLSFWLIGSAGVATLAGAVRPTAFVKPICVKCRLLPVIREHEAIHLSGVASENAVWDSMRTRYSVESLSLAGDPAICSFCPIPKRLAEH